MGFPKVKIISSPGFGPSKFFLNDQEITGVVNYSVEQHGKDHKRIKLEIIADEIVMESRTDQETRTTSRVYETA